MAVVVAGVVLLGLGWGRLAAAKFAPPVPPTIDQILGTWTGSAPWVDYDTTTGERQQTNWKGTVTITKTSDSTVDLHYSGEGMTWDDPAYYATGILAGGWADDEFLGTSSETESWVITGKLGHLTAKGQWIAYSVGGEFMEVGTVSMKQTATP